MPGEQASIWSKRVRFNYEMIEDMQERQERVNFQ